MRARLASNVSRASRKITSPRGTISEPMRRSSRRNTLRTMACSCSSITPALVPSASIAWISSSVTGCEWFSRAPSRRSSARVDSESSRTNGFVAIASHSIGRATSRASASGWLWPSRLGTSSPTTMEK